MGIPTATSPRDNPSHATLHNFHVDVKMFNAKGDGVTDDTAAVNAAETAGNPFFPPGTYIVDGVLADTANRTWRGSGPASILKLKTGAVNTRAVDVTASDVSFEGLAFDPNNITNGTGVYVNGVSRISVQHCKFVSPKSGGVHIAGAATDIRISSNVFSGAGYGILTNSASACSDIAIVGNVFRGGATGDAIEINTPTNGATDILIANNVISDYTATGGNDGFGIGCAFVRRVVISENIITGSGVQGIHIEDGSEDVAITSNKVSACGGEGIALISSNAARLIRRININNNIVQSCGSASGEGGIVLSGTQAAFSLLFANNKVRECGRAAAATFYGIQAYSNDVQVIGNEVTNTKGTATAGIVIGAATNLIAGLNRCYDDQGTPTQDYGIRVQGAQTNLLLFHNILVGNGTGALDESGIGAISEYRKIMNLPASIADNGAHTSVVATASLPAAGAARDGLMLLEDVGAGDRNLIIYAGSERFRIDGGAAF